MDVIDYILLMLAIIISICVIVAGVGALFIFRMLWRSYRGE